MPNSKRAARAAALLGVLAVLAVPAAVLASRLVSGVTLLHSLYVAVATSCVLGLLAVAATRRSRFLAARSVRPEDTGPGLFTRSLAWAGLYVGVTAGLALAVYGGLRWAQ
jgi:hypothetical protein